VVKICLNGKRKDIQLIPNNGFPVRCKVSVESSRDLRLTCPIHFIEVYVPAEYASLLEIGLPLTLTLDQTGS
jgi:hypothetical protein